MGNYIPTTAFTKIASLTKPVRVVQGGKSSSKTISILMYFILLATGSRSGLIMSVVAETLPNLKSGAIRDFEKILKDWNLYHKFKINLTDRTYTYNGNVIEFFSVDGAGSRLGSRRTHLYVNEADFIKFNTYLELSSRTTEFTYLDYNPRRKFWAHEYLIGEPHVDFIKLNFEDNEFIPLGELDTILWFKKKADEGDRSFQNRWRVLGLGELGITEGVIFENWERVASLPDGAKYMGAGIDWGYTDPSTITKVYQYGDKLVLKEALYKRGLTPSQLTSHILGDAELMSGLPLVADAARADLIAEIRSYGVKHIFKSDIKHISSGIATMQEQQFLLIGDNLVKEVENYCWKTTKSGENMGTPIDDYNHAIDGARYFIAMTCRQSNWLGKRIRKKMI